MSNSFEEALLKAKIISPEKVQERIQKEEIQRKKEEKEQLEKEQLFRDQRQRENLESKKNTKVFEDLWRDSKTHKLIVHLIYSYIPRNAGFIPWEKQELKSESCCICKDKIISRSQLIQNIPKISEVSLNHLRDSLKPDSITEEDKMKKEMIEAAGGYLAIVSKDSDKAFCGSCFCYFHDWIEIKHLSGDRTIQQIINNKRLSQQYNLPVHIIIEVCKKASQCPENCSVCELTSECLFKQLKGKFACIESRKRYFLEVKYVSVVVPEEE